MKEVLFREKRLKQFTLPTYFNPYASSLVSIMKTKDIIHIGFFILMSFHVYVLILWNSINTDIAQGVCCSTMGPVFEYIESDIWKPKTSVFGIIGRFAVEYNLGLLPFQLSAIGGVLLLYKAMRKHVGSFASGIASCSILGYPFFAYAMRKWDVYAASMSIIGLLLYLAFSRRRIHMWMLAVLIPLFGFWSPRTTDNLLLLFLFLSIVFFKKLYQRNTSYLFICATLSITGLCVSQFQYASTQGLGYYFQELSHDTAQTQYSSQLFAYVEYIFYRGLGQWNSWIFLWLAPFVLYALRSKQNRHWLFAGIPVLVFLSLIPKKNHYYIFVLWPFLAIYLAIGFHKLPNVLQYPLGLYFLGMNLFPYVSKSHPDGTLAAYMGRRPWIYSMNTKVFQTYDGGLDIRPEKNRWADNAIETLSPPKRCGYIIASYGGLETDEIQLRIPSACPRIHKVPDDNHLDRSGMVLLSPMKNRVQKSALLNQKGFVRQDSIFDKDQQEIWVFKRSKSWFSDNTSAP